MPNAKQFKVEVIADSSGAWVGNLLTFVTRETAEAYATGLFSRWTAVREWRVVEAPVKAGGRKVARG